jgi:hypothetical protein
LGHITTSGEIRMNPEKINMGMKYLRPTTVRKIKQFFDLAGYYKKFIEKN